MKRDILGELIATLLWLTLAGWVLWGIGVPMFYVFIGWTIFEIAAFVVVSVIDALSPDE